MSVRIQYAYLKQQTWLYRRNYPKELQSILGQAFKQSLKTGDARVAKARAAEVNAKYEEIITKARAGGVTEKPAPVQIVVPSFSPVTIVGRVTVAELGKQYLNRRSDELQHGGFKSVRFSVGLFLSSFGKRPIGAVSRDDAMSFTRKVAQLGKHVGKSYRTKGYPLERLLDLSEGERISPQTQKRIISQVGHFMDWAVYEGQLASNPFKTVGVEGRAKPQHYEALTDKEVSQLRSLHDDRIGVALRFCLLSGMRAGEAVGLVRDDLIWKGNLGWFAWIRPNEVRTLKTDAAARIVPLHSDLTPLLASLPGSGRLFPSLSVNMVTKRFSVMRVQALIQRQGVVFHSSRKWFVTQCERAGVPEHFTASIVGHQSARSENRMTYGIYSAGISDEQKREIVEKVGLPRSQ
ncbi:MAG: tyrosine-type recombinase/integrase [Cypionkella sp.]|jgi:integrase|nr:tyrosine-type recombinase/integrase [Cypionkella sp.]